MKREGGEGVLARTQVAGWQGREHRGGWLAIAHIASRLDRAEESRMSVEEQ